MNKRERRELIIDCAKSLFVERGFHNVTVGDIIEKARIARSTFYAHFTSKDEIFSLLMDDFSETLRRSVLAINISRAGDGRQLASEIRSMTLGLIDTLEKNADLVRLLVTASQGSDSAFDRKIGDFYGGVLAAIRQLLWEGTADGNVKPLDPHIISYAILGSIKQVLIQWLVYEEISDIRGVMDDIIRYHLHGIATRVDSEAHEAAQAQIPDPVKGV